MVKPDELTAILTRVFDHRLTKQLAYKRPEAILAARAVQRDLNADLRHFHCVLQFFPIAHSLLAVPYIFVYSQLRYKLSLAAYVHSQQTLA